jgi:hypothetical protein
MSAQIIDLAPRLTLPEAESIGDLIDERLCRSPKWQRTERGHAFWLLTRAAERLLADDVTEALTRLRLALRVLEPVETVTLAEELARVEQFDRRQVSVEKARATRAGNKALAAAQKGGAS